MKTIYNGIIKENPTFVLLLGLCPALAITKTVESAYLMGICVLVILIFSSFVISLIRKLVTDSVRIPVYILIIGTFVTIVEVLLKEYIPNLYSALGIYLPLIVVNCIVLGRAMVVASKENVGKSILDAIGIGLGFTLAISLIALIREVLGTNTITLMDSISSFTGYKAVYTNILPSTDIFPISIFTTSTGAFLTLAFLIALFNKIKGGKKDESN
jgi:Na+-translocating ferredoxin:NAD+ oxidoreductase subunit E